MVGGLEPVQNWICVTLHAKTRLLSKILQNHFITDSNTGDTQL